MLINLSNHPYKLWSEHQTFVAQDSWGEIVDLPFPAINPQMSTSEVRLLAEEYCSKCLGLLGAVEEPSAVHLMGEMVFCYNLITMLKARGVKVVASAAERDVRQAGVIKEVYFGFVSFREY